MPNFPWSAHRADPATDQVLDALLDGEGLPSETGAGLQTVAGLLAALTASPGRGQMVGEASARAEFRATVGASRPIHRSRPRRPHLITSLLNAKLAAAGVAAAVTLGGVAAAAYTGQLPGSVQNLAHTTIGAPRSHEPAHPSTSASPVGPSATGNAAFGLCTAYSHAKAHGDAASRAVAFRNLANAAGGSGNISTYCASVRHPGATPSASGHHSGKPSAPGKPSTHPSGKPTTHPSGNPTSHPSGEPTSHPSGPPSSQPTPSHPGGATSALPTPSATS
jgi:hypothetical protein